MVLNEGNLLDLPIADSPVFDPANEPLYRLLIAEFAGQRGRLDLAVEHYLESARQLGDLEIAKRATRIAVFARDNEAALEAAKIWVEKAPDDPEARQILAAMYIRDGNADEAIAHLEHLLNANADSTARQLTMIANLLSRERDKQTALTVMEQLMERRADDPETITAYALLAIRAEELDKAAVALDRLIQVGAVEPGIAVPYVALLKKHDQTAAALQWLERALANDADDFGLRLIYARLLADSNLYEEARLQFEILVEQTPQNSDVVYALGLLNLQANRVDAARESFERLLELDARADDANFYLAQIAESRNESDQALAYYRAVADGTNYFQAQLRIAFVLAAKSGIAAARQQLDSIVPEDDEQRLNIVRVEGELLTQNDMLAEAMAVYDEVLADTYDMELLYTRAMLAEKMGRLDVLEADLRTIIDKEPDNAQALNALGYTLADRTDRYEEAHGYIQRALELNPDDFYTLDSMGWVLYRLGRLAEAVDYLQRARSIKEDPEVAAHLGEVLWVMGDKEAARDIWNSALKEKPDDQRLLDVIERLTP